jgi:hypothetical protein
MSAKIYYLAPIWRDISRSRSRSLNCISTCHSIRQRGCHVQTSLPLACAALEPESIRDGIFRKGIPASQLAAILTSHIARRPVHLLGRGGQRAAPSIQGETSGPASINVVRDLQGDFTRFRLCIRDQENVCFHIHSVTNPPPTLFGSLGFCCAEIALCSTGESLGIFALIGTSAVPRSRPIRLHTCVSVRRIARRVFRQLRPPEAKRQRTK